MRSDHQSADGADEHQDCLASHMLLLGQRRVLTQFSTLIAEISCQLNEHYGLLAVPSRGEIRSQKKESNKACLVNCSMCCNPHLNKARHPLGIRRPNLPTAEEIEASRVFSLDVLLVFNTTEHLAVAQWALLRRVFVSTATTMSKLGL